MIKLAACVVLYNPDDTIFEDSKFDIDLIVEDMKNRAYVNAGLKINYKCGKETKTFFNENGIRDYIDVINHNPICPTLYYDFKDKEDNYYEIVMNYQNTDDEIVKSFVNGIKVTGVCETAFKQALTTSITSYIKDNNLYPVGSGL